MVRSPALKEGKKITWKAEEMDKETKKKIKRNHGGQDSREALFVVKKFIHL